jgi:Transposase DDE domain
MAVTISKILTKFKTSVADALSAKVILKVCDCLGHSWRERVFDPVTTVHVFLLQILHGNIACAALPHLAGLAFTATAYCQARKRLPLAVFATLLQRVCDALLPVCDTASRWHGHRTWTLDGSSFSMPDTPELQAHFGQPSGQAQGCGFPVAHLLALFHAGTGLLLSVLASPCRTHDMKHAALMHPQMQAGDILIADRALCSFAHLALLFLRNMHAVFRCHQKQIVSFRVGRKHTKQRRGKRAQKGLPTSRYLRRLGRWDQLVEYTKPTCKPKWIDEDTWATLPATLTVREVRYVTRQLGHRTRLITLTTTLLDADAYPAADLAELYLSRWQIEVNIRHLKTTMGMEIVHCKTVDGVTKELCMYAIAYNLVRLAMLEAGRRQKVPLERISFVDALRWLRDTPAGELLGRLVVNPLRPGRIEPRALKRRPKEYDRLNKPRHILRQRIAGKKLAT